jgi:hypothetical protein
MVGEPAFPTMSGAAKSSARPVQILNYQKPPGHTSAQVLRKLRMLQNYETILAAYLERPLLRCSPPWRLANIRASSREASVRAVTATSGSAIDRRHRSRQRRRNTRSGPKTSRARPESPVFPGSRVKKPGARTKVPSRRRQGQAQAPFRPRPPTSESNPTKPQLTNRCKTATSVA